MSAGGGTRRYVAPVRRGAAEPRPRVSGLQKAVEQSPHGEDYGQWTVVRRRLAARSRVKRQSCQGVRWLSRVSPCTYPQTERGFVSCCSASVYASAACFCDSSSRCVTALSTASRVGPISWVLARRRIVRSLAGSASRVARTESSDVVHASCIDAPTCRRRKPATC